MIDSSSATLILGSNLTWKGNGCVFIASKNASTSRGADGSSEIRNAQRWSAVFKNTDLKRRGIDLK
jgi:hypothetical protein